MKSYSHPQLPSFASKAFVSSARARAKRLLNLKCPDVLIKRDRQARSPWVWVVSENAIIQRNDEQKSLFWQPKLYICASSRNYFEVLNRLIENTARLNLQWKYCGTPSEMSRPDKIILYFNSIRDLKRKLPEIRTLLDGVRFHSFSHAASTSELGLEHKGRAGIYIGADPHFLPEMSWRLYHWYAKAWVEQNRDYWNSQGGGVEKILTTLNLSTQHDGPLSFSNQKNRILKIQKIWRDIV